MINPFQPGDTKTVTVRVTEEKLARFEGQLVHAAYSTFALGQDAEWACRQFVLQMTEPGEEGLGVSLSIQHTSPAVVGEEVAITATLERVEGSAIYCRWEARAGALIDGARERLIGHGVQTQRIVEKARFDALLARLQSQDK